MKVVSYLSGIPPYNKDPIKSDLLHHYISGVNVCGDIGVDNYDKTIIKSDVGVLQGWISNNQDKPHLRFRKDVIDYYISNSKYIVTADASLFNYKSKEYLRYSFNGVFPNTGIYCDTVIDKGRWNSIQKNIDIKLLDYKKTGNNILILLQRQYGWSMDGLDVTVWLDNTIKKVRQYSNRTIVVRPHPGDQKIIRRYSKQLNAVIKKNKNVILHSNNSLATDLNNTWAVINHNSSSLVGPIIKGYHCFITDASKSQCTEVSNTDLSKIETPKKFDREIWLQRISMFHWNFEELKDGSCWKHMRQFIT